MRRDNDSVFMKEIFDSVIPEMSDSRREANIAAIRKRIFRERLKKTIMSISSAAAIFLVFFLTYFSPIQQSDSEYMSDYEWMIIEDSFEMSTEMLTDESIIDYLAASGDEYIIPELLEIN